MRELQKLKKRAAELAGCYDGWSPYLHMPHPLDRFDRMWESDRRKYMEQALHEAIAKDSQ